jgi:hypothetical protein
MGYLLKTTVGAALFLGAVVLFNVKLQEMLDIGTCASGNVPYEIAPGYECPEGVGTDIMLMVGSIFAGLIGAGIFAFRGAPPWSEGKRRSLTGMFGWATFAWGIFFAGTGVALLLGGPYGEVVDPATGEVGPRPDSQLGAKIVAGTFLVMGVPALLISLWSLFKGLTGRDRDERAVAGTGTASMAPDSAMARMRQGLAQASGAQQIGSAMGWSRVGSSGGAGRGGDTIGKIERLQKLKESGAITKAEFDKEKAKILAEQ